MFELFRLVLTDAPNALWARTILLVCYGVLILYLVGIEVFKPKIIRSRHRGFWELHLASLPIVAILGLMMKLYSAIQSGVHYQIVFSMIFHLMIMLVLVIGCIVEKYRQDKLLKQI